MPLGKIISNKKRSVLQKKSWRKHRIRKAEKIRKQGGHVQGDIIDAELITAHMLRKRRTSPRANITLSGKKKRKLIKRLRHSQPARVSQADVDMTDTASSRKGKGKKSKQVQDVEMEACDVTEDQATQGNENMD